MMSDGFVAAMHRWVEAGHHLVTQPSVRLNDESVLSDLRAEKLLRAHALADCRANRNTGFDKLAQYLMALCVK
jgi:hypothetical protein